MLLGIYVLYIIHFLLIYVIRIILDLYMLILRLFFYLSLLILMLHLLNCFDVLIMTLRNILLNLCNLFLYDIFLLFWLKFSHNLQIFFFRILSLYILLFLLLKLIKLPLIFFIRLNMLPCYF